MWLFVGAYYFGWKIVILLIKVKIDLILEKRQDRYYAKKRK